MPPWSGFFNYGFGVFTGHSLQLLAFIQPSFSNSPILWPYQIAGWGYGCKYSFK